jgi:hypothetical protein
MQPFLEVNWYFDIKVANFMLFGSLFALWKMSVKKQKHFSILDISVLGY